MEDDNKVEKVDIIKILTNAVDLDNTVTEKQLEILSNALHDIVERALLLEDKSVLQSCEKLGLLENGQWRNLKS